MAKKVYEEANMAAIANKIREMTGESTKYMTSEMPSGIEAVYNAGQRAGSDGFQYSSANLEYFYSTEASPNCQVKGFGTCTDTEVVIGNYGTEGRFVTTVSGLTSTTVTRLIFNNSIMTSLLSPINSIPNLEYVKFGKHLTYISKFAQDYTFAPNLVLDFTGSVSNFPVEISDTKLPNAAAEIRVSKGRLDAWKNATNWAVAADKFVEV